MQSSYVPQSGIVHFRFQRAQLLGGHRLFGQSFRLVAGVARHPERTVRGGCGGRRQPAAQAHQLIAVSQVEHAVVERDVPSF